MSFDLASTISTFVLICEKALACKKWLNAKEEAFLKSKLNPHEEAILKAAIVSQDQMIHFVMVSSIMNLVIGGCILGNQSPRERNRSRGGK